MDSRDRGSAVKFLVDVFRRITRAAKVLPFLYLALFGLLLIFDWWIPDGVYEATQSLLYIPPSVVILSLFLSKTLNLCIWHKTACVIPLFSRVEGYIDDFVFQFTQNEIIIINTAVGILSLAFIFFAYRHFFYGRKATAR